MEEKYTTERHDDMHLNASLTLVSHCPNNVK